MGSSRTPDWAGQVIFSLVDGSRSVLIPRAVEICDELKSGRSIEDFDPSRLAPQTTEGASAKKRTTPVAVKDDQEQPQADD